MTRMPSETSGFRCGVIEGFYGRPWSWDARTDYATFLARQGFDFFVYAPKSDARLRKAWREDWPADDWRALERLRAAYRERGVAFGIGLTPYGAQTHYDGRIDGDTITGKARINNQTEWTPWRAKRVAGRTDIEVVK